ncbi:protein kinase [Streptomyces oceani]|uniref:non-specific serine/threonine protein kinase n=1 Tax=Streptomyces oceani TaxID=1075402 RepID=A0A1E7KHV5_9ACTN|nr:protein kinase [Streptomyces oceani]
MATGGQQDPEAGRLVGGRYQLVARLGQGGMGTVWRAHDQVVEREVAVKEPRVPAQLSEPERQTMYQRMRREVRTAARIDHPSVVTVHDVVVEGEQPWIVMELVQGSSLAGQLAEGTLDEREVARIGLAVLGALDAAHERGVLHRDVKPDNVLLGRYDRVVLTDFGIAQVEGEQGLTETGAFIGSPEYIAPERVLGQRPGPESDLWSLGVVLYAAIEGVSPFRRNNSPATLQAVLSAEPQRPARAPGALGMLIMQLLRKKPSERPAAAEVRRVLQEVHRPTQPAVTGGPVGGENRFENTVLTGARKVRYSRKVQIGIVAVLLAGLIPAVVLETGLMDKIRGDELPSGWEKRDESKRVGASFAVPSDYQRSVGENRVTFDDPGGVFKIYVSREGGIDDSALEDANSRKEFYEDGAQVDIGDDTMEEAEPRVNESTHQGADGAEIVTTYLPPDDYDDSTEELPRLRQEMTVLSEDNVRYRVYVDMPKADEHAKTGEEMFQDVVDSLRINEL